MNPLTNFTALADTWWTWVVHSTWQSSLVVIVAFAVVWLRRKRSASFLYAVLVVALLKFLVPPIVSVPILASPTVSLPAEETPNGAYEASLLPETKPVVAEDAEPWPKVTTVPSSEVSPTPQPGTGAVPRAAAGPARLRAFPSQTEPPAQPQISLNVLEYWKALLALLHVIGIVGFGFVMAGSFIHLRRLLRAARPADDRLSTLAKEVAARLQLRHPVMVLLSSLPYAPMATGLRKRRIVLPDTLTALESDELRAILAHELAHHRRRDLAIIWVEHLVTVFWWFNPLVWFLIRAIHRKREDCCDDVVLSLGLAGNRQYCDTLLHAAKRLHRPFTPRLVFGCANKLHPLGQRLTRIMDTAVRRRAALTLSGIAAVLVFALVLLPTFLPVAAETDPISGTGQGPSGSVLRFDGVDDYIIIPPTAQLDVTGDVTVSAWIKTTPASLGAVYHRGDSASEDYNYGLGVWNGKMCFNFLADLAYKGQLTAFAQAEADVDDQWHYWTGVRDVKDGQVLLYKDGDLAGKAPLTQEVQYDTSRLGNGIGTAYRGPNGEPFRFFRGDIDQISVWNIARRPEDIQREMRKGIKPDEPGLVALWTFDEDGQAVHDSSPSGISATLGSSPEPDASDPARVQADAARAQSETGPSPAPAAKIEKEITEHYAKADREVQDYIRWTDRTFGPSGLWMAHDAFAQLTPQEREDKISYDAEVLTGEYGRHLCRCLAEAGALKDMRLLPGLIKVASYHRDVGDYDCRPKWMAVAALGRQDDVSAVPTLIPLVDHGNQNTRMWARASLVRLTGQNFGDDKQAWGKWWNESGHEPTIDLNDLKPWVPLDERMSAAAAAPPSTTLVSAPVPPESQAVVDALPGELVFKGTYFHRSRGVDLSEPSVVWIKRTKDGEVIAASYLPAFNATTVAHVSPEGSFVRYEGHYHGRNGRPPSNRFLDLGQGMVTVKHEGGEKDGQTERLTVPSDAVFIPNSRPDSYTAHMALAFQSLPGEAEEVLCYDWDNSGKGMASYTVRLENKGKEEITAPAGTFNANHFVETQTSFGDTWFKKRPGHITDYWVLDNGVIVRIFRHREPYELQLLNVETPTELPGQDAAKSSAESPPNLRPQAGAPSSQAAAISPTPSAAPTPAVVPPESMAIVDGLQGMTTFNATYHHRSRGSDLQTPSVLWLNPQVKGGMVVVAYLPAFNETTVARVSHDGTFFRYEAFNHGRGGQAPATRLMDLRPGAVTIKHEGGEKDGEIETITAPAGGLFMPNSRPDSYTAQMALLLKTFRIRHDTDEILCYDYGNDGKSMASYTIHLENVGKEEVTVPAGTFMTNHVIETQLTSGDTWFKKRAGHVTDYWVLDDGIVVRILRHREPYELQLASFTSPYPLSGVVQLNEGATPVALGKAPTGTASVAVAVVHKNTNAGLPDVNVYVQGGPNGSIQRSGTTDADGRFTFGELPAGDYNVGCGAPEGFIETGREQVSLDADGKAEIILRLDPGIRISGRIIDLEGNPIPGAKVLARNWGQSGRRFSSGDVATGADGAYEIGGVPPGGEYRLFGSAAGHYSGYINVQPRGDVSGIDFTLGKGATISGRAVDTEGNALRDAQISLMPDWSSRQEKKGEMNVMWGGQAPLDETGNFSFSDVAPGKYRFRLTVRRDNQSFEQDSTGDFLEVTVGETISSVEAVFPAAESERIEGTVRDETGAPVANVSVDAITYEGVHWGAKTDSDGHYRLVGLGDHTFDIYCFHDELPDVVLPKVRPGVYDADVVMPHAGRISGIALNDVSDEPVGEGSVSIVWHESEYGFERGYRSRNQGGSIQQDGTFTIDRVLPGKTYLKVSAPGYLEKQASGVTVKPGQTSDRVEVRLTPAAIVEGTVLANGQPLDVEQGISVMCLDDPIHEVPAGYIIQGGKYRLDRLPAGTYKITAWARGRGHMADATKRIEATPGQVIQLDFVLDFPAATSP